MRAEEIMTKDPGCVTPYQTVADAVRVMESEDCGIVPVVESDRNFHIVGVVTDRDIALRACREDGTGPAARIDSLMTSNVFCVHPDDDLDRVSQVMQRSGVRRVPVVNDSDELLGIISMKDLADKVGEEKIGN